jgi:hypothetical protein
MDDGLAVVAIDAVSIAAEPVGTLPALEDDEYVLAIDRQESNVSRNRVALHSLG